MTLPSLPLTLVIGLGCTAPAESTSMSAEDWQAGPQMPTDARPPDDFPDVARIHLNPAPVDFGVLEPGAVDEREVVLTNDWDEPLTVVDAMIFPAGESARLSPVIHDDIRAGLTLVPGERYTFTVRFGADDPADYEGHIELMLPARAMVDTPVTGTVGEEPLEDPGFDTGM